VSGANGAGARSAGREPIEQFLELAPYAIVGIAPGGSIGLVNERAELLFGFGREELIGAPVELLVPEGLRGGQREELSGRRKDGREFPAEISLSSIDRHDEQTLRIAAIRDVSERVEAERERSALVQQLDQMRRLDSVGQLAGGIAHDFNNILGVILNAASFVADGLEQDSPMLEDVEEIQRSAERAAALTRQLLVFTRRDAVRPQPLDLNAVVSELEKLLRRVLGEHVRLETHYAEGLWPVTADEGQVEQVLVNLAVNARDAMPGGGRLTIRTSNVELDESYAALNPHAAPGPHVRLAVSDTGSGMDRKVAGKAFEPFFTTKPKGEGTGLGLATVHRIVTDAGGNVQIYSEPSLGTTVNVQLPASGPASAPVPERRQSPRAARGETVLVVEDEDSVRRITRRVLARAGYRVLTAPGGREALEICELGEEPIAVLLTDVIMPDMLGPELAARATRLRPGMAVVFMSGYAAQVMEHETGGGVEVGFVEKPFTAEALVASVDGVLSRQDSG
jgi:PAS domain S-box-containing protein